ncbi:carotenoid 9,10(9',10')-cleavage dioxygenase isoform X2 [Physcomitrium patens]|uniref:carotenoid 9,10-dioxygenase n=1 Tax=Physcomitrium patens TaxID=3218 RepID=A0A7I4CAS5_PHYPA|nr:carotenoid 9,10(9',10')-cleavage dioxygenase-like isoform X2 [Physcomitrium patens]|eukprot:XP_024359542.1 carotenoid 9,10(9',10')-cleavage dioxygenase-like isoform X2 [Physcomitrella patens]
MDTGMASSYLTTSLFPGSNIPSLSKSTVSLPFPLQLFGAHGMAEVHWRRGLSVAASTQNPSPWVAEPDVKEGDRERDDGYGAGSLNHVYYNPKKVEFRRPKVGSWAASVCDFVERAVVWAFDAGLSDKKAYLLFDNYAPVEELGPVGDLPIIGTIPECLNGEFVRVGPNPRLKPISGYHWFDGDGMMHGLNIKDGKATYVARFVKTSRLQQEEYYGAAKFLKIGQLKGLRGLFYIAVEKLRLSLGVLDESNGLYGGNTAFVYHNNRLLALHEIDKPYAIRVLDDGDLQTMGLQDYEQRLGHSFTAHPKIDSTTGELFMFAYQEKVPYLIYRVISKNGTLREPVPITIPECVMMHDFAITENYALFMDLPLRFNPTGLPKGEFIFKFDPSKESRFGILPRYATDESQIRWSNAWEEGDEVVLITCRMPGIELDLELEFKKEKAWSVFSKLFEFRMNLKTGEVKQRQLSSLSTDFPRINEEYTGRKTRFVYCGVFDELNRVIGVVKYDLDEEPCLTTGDLQKGGNVAGVFSLGPGRSGSEAIFVPLKRGMEGPEDDGYLILFVYDENKGTSEAVIIDAKTMAADPVATVKLPRRVPYGFHAHFVSQEQLMQQA